MYWLGLDIGTGGSRALLIDEKGAVAAGFTAPHDDMQMERPGWAEQEPRNWWDAAQKAVQGVLQAAGAKGEDVKAVGLSGQMHGLVLLDAANEVIRPSLIWCDQRSQAQVDFVNATVGRDDVVTLTANPMLTGFTLPKLLWVRDNEPANFESARKIPPAQGLRPLPPDRRARHRGLRRLRNRPARRRAPPLVHRDDRAPEARQGVAAQAL